MELWKYNLVRVQAEGAALRARGAAAAAAARPAALGAAEPRQPEAPGNGNLAPHRGGGAAAQRGNRELQLVKLGGAQEGDTSHGGVELPVPRGPHAHSSLVHEPQRRSDNEIDEFVQPRDGAARHLELDRRRAVGEPDLDRGRGRKGRRNLACPLGIGAGDAELQLQRLAGREHVQVHQRAGL